MLVQRLLDPVHSGNVFVGRLGHVAGGGFDQGAMVVMLHSGGVPATFAYNAEIEAHLKDSHGNRGSTR